MYWRTANGNRLLSSEQHTVLPPAEQPAGRPIYSRATQDDVAERLGQRANSILLRRRNELAATHQSPHNAGNCTGAVHATFTAASALLTPRPRGTLQHIDGVSTQGSRLPFVPVCELHPNLLGLARHSRDLLFPNRPHWVRVSN